jgi:hypothetical protein
MIKMTPKMMPRMLRNLPTTAFAFLALDMGRELFLIREMKKTIRPRKMKSPPSHRLVTMPCYLALAARAGTPAAPLHVARAVAAERTVLARTVSLEYVGLAAADIADLLLPVAIPAAQA